MNRPEEEPQPEPQQGGTWASGKQDSHTLQ